MLDRGVSGAQVSWSVVTGIYRTFWISNYIQNYFWYQTFLNVSTSFIIRYTLRVVFYISKADWWNIKTREALKVYQKVHFLDRFFFCKDFNQLNFFFFTGNISYYLKMKRYFNFNWHPCGSASKLSPLLLLCTILFKVFRK